MKRSTEKRRQARERKAKSRRLAEAGVVRCDIWTGHMQHERLKAWGFMDVNAEDTPAEIARGIYNLLNSNRVIVTRDTRALAMRLQSRKEEAQIVRVEPDRKNQNRG